MELQYLSDAQGNHTAVVVPIEEWNVMVQNHSTGKVVIKSKKPSDFFGILDKEEAKKFLSQQEKLRNEWERNI